MTMRNRAKTRFGPSDRHFRPTSGRTVDGA
jgi:hypothetical protein